MRHRFLLLAAVVLFLSSVMAESALTQERSRRQAAQGGRRAGRRAARPRPVQGAAGAPGRSAGQAGAALGGRQDPAGRRHAVGKRRVAARRRRRPDPRGRRFPSSRGRGRVLDDRRQEPARASHPLQAVRRHAPVPDAVRRRVRRSPRTSARLHLRHRRPAHLSDHLHGRTGPSRESRAELLRALHRLVGRRHAGRRQHRLQRRLLDGPARLAAHRQAAHARALHPHRFADDEVRSDHRRSRRLYRDVEERFQPAMGSRAPSCSSTSASRPTTRTS